MFIDGLIVKLTFSVNWVMNALAVKDVLNRSLYVCYFDAFDIRTRTSTFEVMLKFEYNIGPGHNYI